MPIKTYTVVKDGKELKMMKTLTAAKKLADAEDAEVYADGKCVYISKIVEAEILEQAEEKLVETLEEKPEETPEPSAITAEPIISEKPSQSEVKEPKMERYRLKALMNVRRKPSMDAQILFTKSAGTIVRVLGIEQDWMHLTEGSYILYEGGRWAEKLQ